jgi:activator of HSP90 ATPase
MPSNVAMHKTIEQSVHFPASARTLYDIYLDPKRHAAVTGGPVKISAKPGSKFTAFNGMLWGTTVTAIPGKLIVQRWRSCEFKEENLDSVLILTFIQDGKRGRIDLVHANVPEHDHNGVNAGWEKYYWKPLRVYLKGRGAGK